MRIKANEVGGVSAMTVWRVLRALGKRKTKSIRKSGLTEDIRKARLEWCLKYEYWTIEDWKRVIFSDETAIVLGVRRFGTRVWRTKFKVVTPRSIRPRWKGYTKFIF